jgi:hypothetical protein
MGARATMRERATIQRDASQAAESGRRGQKPEPDWQDHLTAVPCHVWFNAGREIVGTDNAVVEDRRMLVPKGTDVTESDRVSAVTDRRGNALEGFDGPMRIETVGARADHLVVYLEAV